MLAEVISTIKDAVNQMTAAQADARKEQDLWDSAIADATTAEDFNLLMKLSLERKYRAPMKAALIAAATKAGLAFDKTAKAFVVAEGVAA